ncbi:hypothetical protein SLNSH_14855 [Alsobacter soli]|uniref:Methyltransferase type 11 domain-containing protein n=1 Tax=Alsobacter soli TaxID=2109933 RepID=A0A2T1HRJ4_9HYPH|nr:methyltransferase domain-containing protein [Alsobacter soli]PSC04267.1 hypothetical protein SLNSH_14855 [Alsobacter soli]
MSVTFRSIAIGVASCLPGLRGIDGRRTGGTSSARYCYAVWMRHLALLAKEGRGGPFDTVVEIGPGDSNGVGLAALLSGSRRYIGLDARPYASADRNADILEELVELFRRGASIPDHHEFPGMFPRLASYRYPADLEPDLSEARLAQIRRAVRQEAPPDDQDAIFRSIAPWRPGEIPDASVDLTLTQTVFHLVEDLPGLYADMARWTKPGGLISHELDFKSLGRTREWNGHWTCSDAVWDLLQRHRTNRMNREPFSRHLALAEGAGFEVVQAVRQTRPSEISRDRLAPRFAHMSDEDLVTSSGMIQAVRI